MFRQLCLTVCVYDLSSRVVNITLHALSNPEKQPRNNNNKALYGLYKAFMEGIQTII